MRAAFLTLLCASTIPAATVFEDDFCTAEKWTPANIIDAFVTTSVEDCQLSVRDSGRTTGILKGSASLPDNYTATLTFQAVSEPFTRVGLITNYTDPASGYAFTVSAQGTYQISVVENGLYLPKSGYYPNPAISPFGVNTLKLHRIGNEIHLLCNGNYLEKIVDSTYKGGSVGLIVSPGATVKFDRITVTDNPDPGTPVTCISDNFATSGFIKWNDMWVGDSFRVENGGLNIHNSTTNSSVLFLRGTFQGASFKATASRIAGTGLYGIGFVDLYFKLDGSPAYKFFSFMINTAGRYAVATPGSASMPLVSAPPLKGSNDTLEMRWTNGSYDLYANGTKLTTVAPPDNFEFDAAGFIMQPNTSARFDDLRAGGSVCIAEGLAAPYPATRQPSRARAALNRAYDIRGRALPTSYLRSGRTTPRIQVISSGTRTTVRTIVAPR